MSQCCFCLRGKFFTFFVSVPRIVVLFKNMPLIIITSPFFFCCCVFRGRGRRRGAVLKGASHHAAHPETTQMFERKVYLAVHVLLLSRVATVMSVGLVMDGGAVRGGAGLVSRTSSGRDVCMGFGSAAAHESAEL